MKEKETKQPKKKKVIQQIQQPIYNSPEFARLGELSISSEVLRCDVLMGLLISALSKPDVKKYLKVIDKRKQAGDYHG